jgi:hypothetical protein
VLVKLLVVAAAALGQDTVQAQVPALVSAPVQAPVQLGVRVQPETVTVGQPFRVIVRIRAERGARIEFPLGPDTAGVVQSLDTRVVTDAPDTSAAEATAVYRLAAWDVGRHAVGIPEVTVRTHDASRRVPLDSIAVVVRAVTPRGKAARPPRPARPVFVAGPPWWQWAIPLGIGLLVLTLLWWLLSHRRPRPAATVAAVAVAGNEFDRIDALGLLEAGERGRYVALVTEVLRAYLARRIPGAAIGLTNGEVVHTLRADPRVPVDRLAAVLRDSDMVKFARHTVSIDQASDVGQQARRVVAEIEAAVTAAARRTEAA